MWQRDFPRAHCADKCLHRDTLPTEGTGGLTVWQWRQWVVGVVRASFRATLLRTRRSAAAGFLALLLVTPYGAGLLRLAGNETSSCGMRCCKGTKVCCCHRAGKNALRGGPSWVDSSKCPGGCGQLPAVPAIPIAGPAAALTEIDPITPESRLRVQAASIRLPSETDFASFERPPPAV